MLRQLLENYFNRRWYEREAKHWFWSPLSRFYQRKVVQKREAYLSKRINASFNLPPVLVVGNITVGGTGKTPLVIYLLEKLTAEGLKVAVISRGYGGKAEQYPSLVGPDSKPDEVGDEPYMIYQRTGVSIVVDPDRGAALRYLASVDEYDLVISDDGLQHYNLDRQFEIVVMDSVRGIGNGACLPAGPLREPVERLSSVDAVVLNGEPSEQLRSMLQAAGTQISTMTLQPDFFVSLVDRQATESRKPLDGFLNSDHVIHAIAAIGNPQRFFNTLDDLGVEAETHAFPDHHLYTQQELAAFKDGQLLMTEKDAVKVRQVMKQDQLKHAYYLSITAQLDSLLIDDILSRFKGE